jgi:uncharacterized protein (TIGR03437 family)
MYRTIILGLALLASAFSAVRWGTDAGIPLHRTDFTNIVFKLNAATAQGLINDGDPAAAIQAAMDSWNSIPNTALHFAPLGSTAAGLVKDSQNVISFADSPETRSALGGAPGATIIYFDTNGGVSESDIILNPAYKFSVSLQPNSVDLQSVITHELGHALGANHATVVSSTMFWLTNLQDRNWSQLKADDAAFAVEAYPAPGAAGAYGKIAGRATKDGSPLLGAGILALDSATGVSIGGISSFIDATFSLTVPPGNYQVYAAPTAPFTPSDRFYGIPTSRVDSGFKVAPADSVVQVVAGSIATVAIATSGGSSSLSIDKIGRQTGTLFTWNSTGVAVQSGQSTEMIVFGAGLDASITEQNITFIGSGIQLRAGTLRVFTGPIDNGRSPLRFTVDVAARTTPGTATLFIMKGGDSALLSGGIAILPVKPAFTAAGIVDAASSKGAGVAPGELVSLYGLTIGPDTPAINGGYDPTTGLLPATLGGVTVTFDGIPAPMLYASSGQINLQVPYETGGKKTTTIVVMNQGTASDPISVPVLAAQPGLFQVPGSSQAIADNNQDGTRNGPSNPAPKGTYVVFYATGGGAGDPPVGTGKPAPLSPLSYVQSATMTIGGIDAPVYVGGVLAPGFVGLMQVAAQVPANAPTGSAQAILTIAGQSSPPANIFVK